MKILFEETRCKSTRDENERPLREKSMKILSEETWCMHAIKGNMYLCTDYLRFFLKTLLCLVPLIEYHVTSSLQDASVVAFLSWTLEISSRDSSIFSNSCWIFEISSRDASIFWYLLSDIMRLFLSRCFYWVLFEDASVEFPSKTLLSGFHGDVFVLKMLLSEFHGDVSVWKMLLSKFH